MKFFVSQLLLLFQGSAGQRNYRLLMKFFLVLSLMIAAYSILFHFLMLYEAREFSWITGIYWTLTVMSTLGFGDITFTSDLGKLFSVFVLLSGIVFLLILFPFTFVQFFYAPWLERQSRARAPRELPPDTAGHVILTGADPLSLHLVSKLAQYQTPYALVATEIQRALELHEQGYRVVLGELGDPAFYRGLRAARAALVVANHDDMANTNIAFAVREVAEEVPIVANAEADDSEGILQAAGCTHTFQFMRMLGQALARRTVGGSGRANVIGQLGDLVVAEAPAAGTPLVGTTLRESRLRTRTGLTLVGVWERAAFQLPTPQTPLHQTSILLLAGSAEQFRRYDELYVGDRRSEGPVLILGGGRVGRAAAETLRERGVEYRIIEKNLRLSGEGDRVVRGNAADMETLTRAGIREAPSAIITTHEDVVNIYLTLYLRRLRPEMQIVSRANLERNISKLHRAGADLAISYASMGANAIINLLKGGELLLAEGLNMFRLRVPAPLAGQSVVDSRIREETGCSVVAIRTPGRMEANPEPSYRFQPEDELILIGSEEAERRFLERFGP